MPLSFRGKNKKQIRNVLLVSFFIFSAAFMLHVGADATDLSGSGIGVMSAHADEISSVDRIGAWLWDNTIGAAINGPLFVVNVLLYMFLQLLSLVLVLATTIFGWAVNPAAAHNMLNMASVYTLWRMIRDFFNLFFILTILFIAFSTIFQVSAYNYKKLLWHLVLMALLVNFSFPVTRFIIDATNVPMYFFMENIFRDKSQADATQLFGTVFSSTNLREILIPDFGKVATLSNAKSMTLQLLTSIIFMFLFSMSLLVLALLFLFRLVILTVLIIFSPVGYAGTAIPGFEKYAKQWWESLMKHAIFGPTAMLMLLVAITFLREFKVNQSVPTNSFSSFSKELTSDQSQADIISAMATSIVPIFLIWTAISVGQMVGVQGASGVTSWAQKASKTLGKNSAKWTGRGAKYGSAMALRNATTTRDKDGNVVARGGMNKLKVGKFNMGDFAESRARKSFAAASIREEKRSQLGFRKNRRELLSHMSEADLLKELQASKSGTGLMLGKVPGKMYGLDADVAQTIIKKGAHKKLKSDDANIPSGIKVADPAADGGSRPATNGEILQMLHKTLESVGDKDNLKTLESDRADVMFEALRRKEFEALKTSEAEATEDQKELVKKNVKIKAKVEQWVADGEHKKASNVNVMNEKFVETLVGALEVDKAMEKIAEMPSNVTRRAEEVAETALKKAGDGGTLADFKATEHWRKLGAGVSSNAHKFFSTKFDGEGKLIGEITDTAMIEEARKYANKMKSARIEKLSGHAAQAFAAVASVGYIQNAGEAKLSAETKEMIYKKASESADAEIQNELRNSPKWKSFSSSGGRKTGTGRDGHEDYSDDY
ncbi:MAG: hypothetical protein HGA33_00595 [Candidatus Moranbacteria bacterium]|nr:hypothetical protein [Candidatus Moranbacteria bacterium]